MAVDWPDCRTPACEVHFGINSACCDASYITCTRVPLGLRKLQNRHQGRTGWRRACAVRTRRGPTARRMRGTAPRAAAGPGPANRRPPGTPRRSSSCTTEMCAPSGSDSMSTFHGKNEGCGGGCGCPCLPCVCMLAGRADVTRSACVVCQQVKTTAAVTAALGTCGSGSTGSGV